MLKLGTSRKKMGFSLSSKMMRCCLMNYVRKNYTRKKRKLAKRHARLKKKGSKRKRKLKKQKKPPQKLR